MENLTLRFWSKSKKRFLNDSEADSILQPGQSADTFHTFINDGDIIKQLRSDLPDETGTLICEGDIIDHFAVYGTVLFEDGMFALSMSAKNQFGNHRQPLCYIDSTKCKIIGNNLENPEMVVELIN